MADEETTVRRPRFAPRAVIRSAAATDTGLVRTTNEDAVLDRPEIGLWAVADGVGGADAGDRASAAIVASLAALPAPTGASELLEMTQRALQAVNGRLFAESHANGFGRSIASTVVCLVVHDRRFFCVWAGDSRLYRLRGRHLEQLSRDHSEVQSLLDEGLITSEEARLHPRANAITRAVGAHPDLHLDRIGGEVEFDDCFLLCSDGLTKVVDEPAIAGVLARAEPAEAVDRLIAMTLERGAPDNVSVAAIRTSQEYH